MLLSFNNAGFALLSRDIDQPAKLEKAVRLLKRAEDLGVRDNDPELAYPLFNLAVYYFVIGDVLNARAYARRWRQVDNSPARTAKRTVVPVAQAQSASVDRAGWRCFQRTSSIDYN